MIAAAAAPPLAAAESLLGQDLLVPLGALAAIGAMIGMILLLPIVVSQRREIARLDEWYEQEPEAGDNPPGSDRSVTTVARPSGPMTAAERVTSERPALERIGTAERAAIELEQAPFWRRVIIRGPRHPLVISLLALLAAAAILLAAGLFLRARDDNGARGEGLDRASVQVVVLNASSSPGLAGDVADGIAKDGFTVTGTTTAEDTSKQSVVQYDDEVKGAKSEGKAVARSLGIQVRQPFDSFSAAKAAGAHVVVIAGEDQAEAETKAKAPDGKD